MSSTVPFLMTKAHAYHSNSPTLSHINGMLNATSVVEIEAILANTVYAHLVTEARPSIDLTKFEIALRRDYAQLLSTYVVAADPTISELLIAFAMLIEADNMTLILQAIIRKNADDSILESIIPVGRFGLPHYKRMLDTTTVEAASDFIIYPKLRKAVQTALTKSDDPDYQIYYLASALSHASYEILQKVAPQWVKNQVELLNLQTICRAIKLDIKPNEWLIPNFGIINRYRSILVGMLTPRDVLNFVLPHFFIKRPLRLALEADDDKIVEVLEEASLEYQYHKHQKNFTIYGLKKESILDFFAIKKAEIEDISKIILGTIKGIPSETVEGMLKMPIYRR